MSLNSQQPITSANSDGFFPTENKQHNYYRHQNADFHLIRTSLLYKEVRVYIHGTSTIHSNSLYHRAIIPSRDLICF